MGFEPMRPYTNPNGLANRPLQPLEYFSRLNSFIVAERVGFEPTAPFGVTGFQDQLLKPLGHLSIYEFYYFISSIAFKMVTHRRFELRTP